MFAILRYGISHFPRVWDDFISVLPVPDTSMFVCSVLNSSMNLHPSLLHIPRVVLCRHRSIQTGSFCDWLVRLPISFHHKPFELGRCARTFCPTNLVERLKMFSTDQPSARNSASTGPSALVLSYTSSSAFSLIHVKLLGLAVIILLLGPMSLDVLNVWWHILLVGFLEQVPMF